MALLSVFVLSALQLRSLKTRRLGDDLSKLHRLYLVSSAIELSLALPEEDLAQLASSFAYQKLSERLKAEYKNLPTLWLSSLTIEIAKPSLYLINLSARKDSLRLETERWNPALIP